MTSCWIHNLLAMFGKCMAATFNVGHDAELSNGNLYAGGDMERLPDELLIEIFSYFDVKYLSTIHIDVCKRWRKLVAGSASLNSHFSLDVMDDLLFLKAWPGSHHIKTLVIRLEVDLINALFIELEAVCPNLTSLTVHKCNVLSERHVHRLSKCFPRLLYIDVFLTSHFISQHFLDILSRMKCIVLNNQIDEQTLRSIANNCHHLKELHMYGYVQFYPLPQLQNLLTLRFNQLTKLTLRCYEVNDKTCQIIGLCSRLRLLCLYHCWLITDAGLGALASLGGLTTLHLTGLKLVTGDGLGQFLQALGDRPLANLNFSSSVLNDYHAFLLSQKLANVRVLELWNCKCLSSVGIDHIVTAFKKLYILDLNMQLSDKVLGKIVFESDIKILTFDNRCNRKIIVPENRNLVIRPAFRCYDEFYFRGNSEGFRANVLCYSYQHQLPYRSSASESSS